MGGCSRKPLFLVSSLQAVASQRHFVSQIISERSMNVGHQKGKNNAVCTWSSRDPWQAASCPLGYSWPIPGTVQKIKIRVPQSELPAKAFQKGFSSTPCPPRLEVEPVGQGLPSSQPDFPRASGGGGLRPAGLWFGRVWRDAPPRAAVGNAHASAGLLHRHPAACCAPSYGAATPARH